MSDDVTAEIIAIGTEILLGEITDTNSVFLAQKLRDLGINLYYMTSVGDNERRIADAIRLALSRADIVITCGGLGPTIDDMTRQGIATAAGRELIFQQNLYDQIVTRFANYKVKMTNNNRRQAFIPQGAIPIDNPVGTAPSFIVEQDSKIIISLPGVPREMKFLMTERITPYLLGKYKLGIIRARILKTAGIGESSLDDMLGSDLLEQSNPSIGLAAHHGIIDIRITAKAQSPDEADALLEGAAQQVISRAGEYIFGGGNDRLEDVLVEFLHRHQSKLSVVEAGLDNAIVSRLHATRGGHGVIAYEGLYRHPDELRQFVSDGGELKLPDLAKQIAQNIAEQHRAEAGIAILSLPDVHENPDIEYATAVAVFVNGDVRMRMYGFGAQFDLARDWVSRWAMAIVWRMLKDMLSGVE